MKKYKVKVNNKLFEVEVEEISSSTVVENKELVKKEETKAAPKAATGDVSGEEVLAPLPGNIISIDVSKGDQVNEGDVIFILEAMKMENEITAPASGTVKEIYVTQGASVDTEEVLAIIE